MHPDTEDNTPWYRQPWAWFLLTPLIVIVLVMAVLISIAVRWSDDVVVDNYSREGRMYNERLEQDQRARDLNLQAQLEVDPEAGEVWLTLTGERSPDNLMLLIQHPTEADLDQAIRLSRVGAGRYRGDLDYPLAHHRYLQLFAGDSAAQRTAAEWRLKGELDFSLAQSVLLSAPVR